MYEISFNKILVPVDFSYISLNALDTAIAIAKRQGSQIDLINVVDTSFYFGLPGEAFVSDKSLGSVLDISKEMTRELKERVIKEHQVRCESISTKGYIPSAVVRASEELQSDLIVMGTHGVSGFREFFMGSNAYKVVQHAACPVLTIPPGKSWSEFKKILFPVRPLPGAIEKYDTVRKLIVKNHASLEILGLTTRKDEIPQIEELTGELKKKLEEDHIEAHIKFYSGKDLAKGVLKNSGNNQVDLILISAFLEPSVKRFFLSAYTQSIINHSKVPVFSVRPELRNEIVDGPPKMDEFQPGFTPAFG